MLQNYLNIFYNILILFKLNNNNNIFFLLYNKYYILYMTVNIQPRDIYIPAEDLFNDIGILDINYTNLNPLNGKPYSNKFKTNIIDNGKGVHEFYEEFTIYQRKEEIVKGIFENQVIILQSGTGSGKTLLSPKLALHTMGYKGKIAMTNPKTIPSKSAAIFAAKTLDVTEGKEVGYKYKGSPEGSYSPEHTKLLFCTDGYIKALMIGNDPLLEQYDMVIVDEVHERNVNIDILLLLLRRALLRRRSLKLMIVSATINEKLYIDYFPSSHFKSIYLDGGASTTFPIKLFYLEKPLNRFNPNGEVIGDTFVESAVKRVCDILLSTTTGDILIFLTGSADIKKGCEKLHILLNSLSENINNETFCITISRGIDKMHEKLVTDATYYMKNQSDAQEYDKNATGPFKRKVVFATEIAESSITINGLIYVIDAGLSKQSKYYATKNMNALEKKYIAKSNHLQRRGRVGRTSPGECHCIFTVDEYNKLFKDYPDPPITISNFTSSIVDFLLLDKYISHIDLPINIKKEKVNMDNIMLDDRVSLNSFLTELLDIPNMDNIQLGIIRLYYLNIIKITENKAYISKFGKLISGLQIDSIELRRAMISSHNYKCTKEVCAISSMIEILGSKIMSLFTTTEQKEITQLWHVESGEFMLLLDIFNEFVHREYDQQIIEDGRTIKIKKLGGTKQWCKRFKINYSKMIRIYEVYLSNFRDVNKIINRELYEYLAEDEYNLEENFILFGDKKPILYQNTRLNVIRALLDGFFINVLKKNTNMTYTTCFPSLVKGSIDKYNSFFQYVDDSVFKYCFYFEYSSISMVKTFNLVNGIPREILQDIIMDDNIYEVFKNCLSI